MRGHELLEFLLSLTAEELDFLIIMEGCDCDDVCHKAKIVQNREEIHLKRPDYY